MHKLEAAHSEHYDKLGVGNCLLDSWCHRWRVEIPWRGVHKNCGDVFKCTEPLFAWKQVQIVLACAEWQRVEEPDLLVPPTTANTPGLCAAMKRSKLYLVTWCFVYIRNASRV